MSFPARQTDRRGQNYNFLRYCRFFIPQTPSTDAILSGKRDAKKLAELRDPRIKASQEEVIRSLEAFRSEKHLFELKQCYKVFEFHNEMIAECDVKTAGLLQEAAASRNGSPLPERQDAAPVCHVLPVG